jgi:hypothetical protein
MQDSSHWVEEILLADKAAGGHLFRNVPVTQHYKEMDFGQTIPFMPESLYRHVILLDCSYFPCFWVIDLASFERSPART